MVISEEEVKRSFAKVKEDILQVKRSLNKQLFSIEGLNKSASILLGKEEFYAFVKRLGARIEGIENSFPAKADSDDVAELSSELNKEISKLRQAIAKRDELVDEVRSLRSLKGKLAEIEGIAVSKADFSKELERITGELAKLKSSAEIDKKEVSSLSDAVSKLSGQATELEAGLNSLLSTTVRKEETSAFTARIESSHREVSREFASLKRDVDKRIFVLDSTEERLSTMNSQLSGIESSVSAITSDLARKYADKATVEKSIAELKSQLEGTRKLLESSMSEVNMGDYATKRSLKQQLSSFSESIQSGISARMAQAEEQLAAMAEQSGKFQRKMEKQLQNAADGNEIKKLQGQMGRMATSDELYPKLQRMETSATEASEDFKRELKKQREIFEERLKLLESHYKSSNATLAEEVHELKSKLKGISKAGEQAKADMAKITVTAAKAAAKSAAEILEEVDKEPATEKKNRKGISPIFAAILILAMLAIGSVAYIALKEPAPAPGAVTEPAQPIPNKTPVPDFDLTNASEAESATPPNKPIPELDNNAECKNQLECTARGGGEYWFDCYFDNASQQCRCFAGSVQDCPQLMAENESRANATIPEAEAGHKEEKSFGLKYYAIVAFILAAIAFLAYKALSSKNTPDERKEEPALKEEKAEKAKPKKEKAPEKKETEEGESDVIDLEEFFEKKEKKK